MSRSVKKHPVCTDGRPGTTKEMKKYANKAVRNADFDEIPLKGKGYRKKFQTYNIHDWIHRWTREQAIKDWEESQKHKWWKEGSFEEYMNYWEKCCKRK